MGVCVSSRKSVIHYASRKDAADIIPPRCRSPLVVHARTNNCLSCSVHADNDGAKARRIGTMVILTIIIIIIIIWISAILSRLFLS